MTELEQDTAIANEAREEIDADFAVGMVRDGFHVFIDDTNELLTYDMVFGLKEPYDFDNETHLFTAPMMEVAQESVLEVLCESFDSLNDDIKSDGGMSLDDYANEVYDEYDDESKYRWRHSLSEWENIRISILSGKMEYLRRFLNDVSLSYSSRAAELRENLDNYAEDYLNADLSAKRGESRGNTMAKENKQDWRFYVIPDMRTWAFPSEYEKQSKIEYFNSFEEAKKRFDELRKEPYNYEHALARDGQPSARLAMGVERGNASFDILHVRAGQNVLVEDFTRSPDYSTDSSLLSVIHRTAAEIGFDKVNSYPVLKNGTYGKPSLVPFDKWAEEYMVRYEAEHGADGYGMFPDTEARTDNIRQQQDISHKTTNDVPSAAREESQGNSMEQLNASEDCEDEDMDFEP